MVQYLIFQLFLQMLVYEFMTNGSLRDLLSGHGKISLFQREKKKSYPMMLQKKLRFILHVLVY